MISSNLTAVGESLCKAAGRRSWTEVERLAIKVGAVAAEEIRALPAGDAAKNEIAGWLKELYHRTELLARIGRAAQASELRQVAFLGRYLPNPDRRAERVKLAL